MFQIKNGSDYIDNSEETLYRMIDDIPLMQKKLEKVKKKINDATSLSVLGTVSSSSTQKRAVNLNYKINQSISVEGVYESISTDDSEVINDENSIGADVKWKWSFK